MSKTIIRSYGYYCTVWLDRDFGNKERTEAGVMLLAELINRTKRSDDVIRAKIVNRILIKYPDMTDYSEIQFKQIRIKEY